MNPHVLSFSILSIAVGAFLAGCSSAPAPSATAPAPSAEVAAPQAPAPNSADAAAPRAAETQNITPESTENTASVTTAEVTPPELSPEAAAVVERLTQAIGPDTLQHELSDTTGFPEALRSLEPGARAPRVDRADTANMPPAEGLTADGSSTRLVVRDWTGLVLVPISTSLSKAYTSEVRLLKVEAHPLTDGRVRIWTRIHNISNRTLPGQVACSFRMRGVTTPTSPYFYELQVPARSYRDVFFISPDGELTSYTVLVRSEEMKKRR